MSKPFNLEAALAGEPVETRDGRKVTEIHHFKTCTGDYPVTAVIAGCKCAYPVDGRHPWGEAKVDLVMASKKHQAWHCVYKYAGGVHATEAHYKTEEELMLHMKDCLPNAVIIKTYCTEWEE